MVGRIPLLNRLQSAAESSGSKLNLEQLEALLAERSEKPLLQSIAESSNLSETDFLRNLAPELGFEFWDDSVADLNPSLSAHIPARIALRYQLLPAGQTPNGALLILTHDPFDLLARQALAILNLGPVSWGLTPHQKLMDGLQQVYGVGADTFEELIEERDVEQALADLRQETTNLDEEDSEASVVKFVNQFIRQALDERATDIHLEPLEDDLRIRYRIDGVLKEVPVPPQIKLLQASVISRIKIMAHLDIAERRLPQDGRINLELDGRPIDVRVATIPSVTGESISLRLLGQQKFDFGQLGLDATNEEKIRSLLAMPNGIILLTGPTGCGKSTSLYTFLTTLNTKDRRIVTIEDPVENKLPGVIQIAVKPEIDLTFAKGLRSILRGDPNVIMIGEMRDFETVEIAIRSALTGHLVFSTLHTNDAVGGITRLVDMGVEPFLVSSSVRAFIAQRLVRVLCPKCRTPSDITKTQLAEMGFPTNHDGPIYQANGCESCRHTGYSGRRAIYEICLLSQNVQDLIVQGKSSADIRRQAIEEGMTPLRQDGWNKVVAGITSVEEVIRVTAADASAD